MPRNWATMTPEERDAYNLIRRQKYSELTPEAKDLIRAKNHNDYEGRKSSYGAKLASLDELEAKKLFFRREYARNERQYAQMLETIPIYGPDKWSNLGRERVKREYDNFQLTVDRAWGTYINPRRFNAKDFNLVDTFTHRCAKRYVRFQQRCTDIYLHWCKFGQFRPGPYTARAFKLCELWQRILILMGRKCAICGTEGDLPDFFWRPVPKWDPMHIVPNAVWALEKMIEEGLDNHQLICSPCHRDMRLWMAFWLWAPNCPRMHKAARKPVRTDWDDIPTPGPQVETFRQWRKIYPSDDEALRAIKPRWLMTEEVRDGRRRDLVFIRRTDSHVFWRNQPRTQTPVHQAQGVCFYKFLYPEANTDCWGLGHEDEHFYDIHAEGLLSEDFREFLRTHPPGQNTPLSRDDSENIYKKYFKFGTNLLVKTY